MSAKIPAIDVLIAGIFALTVLGFVMVLRQWHFASELCEKAYQRGWATGILENGRMHVRLFENLIYGFYRKYPHRFTPIILLQIAFHTLGVLEVWFVLSRISAVAPTLFNSFLFESISRVIRTTFKLIPFVIGVDEAGAQFVAETLALGAIVGTTLPIIRKGVNIFWTLVGMLLIAKRGLSIKEFTKARTDAEDEEEKRRRGEEEKIY